MGRGVHLAWAAALLVCSTSASAQDVTGAGLSRYYGQVPITSEPHGGQYRLKQGTRNLQVQDKRFSGSSYDVTNPTSDWSDRYTLSMLSISSLGTAWQDLEDLVEPDLELRLCTSTGQVVRSIPFNIAVPFSMDFLASNVVLQPGADRLLLVDDDLFTDDTLAYVQIPLTGELNNFSIGGWPNGLSGTISTIEGDAAVDVYWGLMQAYDFFSASSLNWSATGSCTNQPGLVTAYTNVPPSVVASTNASAKNPCNQLNFGMGVSSGNGPRVSMDWVAHEYAHLVLGLEPTACNVIGQVIGCTGLEARALSEAFSDMMGACVERHVFMTSGITPPPGTDHWTFGEHTASGGQRSMSAPFVGRYDPAPTSTWAQVVAQGLYYEMAGVADRWFHLLVEGGSGVAYGAPYNVTGVGWDQAREVALHGFTTNLFWQTSNPTFSEAVIATVDAAEELYPGTSVANSVLQAWAAVGLVSATGCPGEATWVAGSGTFTDGSGSVDYANNLTCDWLIKPTGADSITVYFTSFNLGSGDVLYIHGGDDIQAPILDQYTGTTVPPLATYGSSSLTISFVTDGSGTGNGWTLHYTTEGTAYCSSAEFPLTAPSGTVTDGSGASPYAANTQCGWYIAPPGATSVTLTFTAFDTEAGADFVNIYDGLNTTVPPIATISGSSLPGPVTAPSGSLFIEFISNSTNQGAGWSANYTSTGTAYCGGTTTLTAGSGSFDDGSGANTYYNNSQCGWSIQPAGASAVQLSFTAFDIEPLGTYGQLYDYVRVYDGPDANAPVLGTYAGNSVPGLLVSSGPALYVEFVTDNATVGPGWSASYTGLSGTTCSGTQLLTAASGSFEDGSGSGDYANNSVCNWLIEPENAVSITLTFDAFDTQLNADGVIVYAGPTTSSPVLGVYTGNTLPPVLTSSSGSILVRLVTDAAVTGPGFSAHYTANIVPPGAPGIVGYEYWYDEDDAGAVFQAVLPAFQYTLDDALPTAGLQPGLHVLHLRFKDSNGQWSSVLSRPFFKSSGPTNGVPELTAMEYWFDEDPGNAVTLPLSGAQVLVDTDLETNGLAMGLHTLHVRFLGTGGWSSVLSRPFFQGPVSTSGTAVINGYEYWFDDDPGNAVNESITPVQQLNLSDVLETSALPTGLHVLHIRFHGTGGWSSVLSRPFFKAGNAATLPNLIDGYRYWFDVDDANAFDVTLASPQTPYTLATSIDAGPLSVGDHDFHIQFRDLAGNWSSVLSQTFTRTPPATVAVPIRLFLEGPFDGTAQLMSDGLRTSGLVPLTEPFSAEGFIHVGEGGNETISPAILSVAGNDAIVDWVFVEARDKNNAAVTVNTRSALVQRDGDVVDLDGVSALSMALSDDDYYIVVRHRNHLGVMSFAPVALSNASALLDLTQPSTATYGTEAQKLVGGRHVLWAGNVQPDGQVKYTGSINDRDPILQRIGGVVPTNTVLGYYPEDATLDGVVKYTGTGNDRDRILINIGGVVPTQIRIEQVP